MYPGFSLGTPFFAKQKSKGNLGSRSLGYGGKAPGKFLIFTFREPFKHDSVFPGLIASNVKMFRNHQIQ